MKKLCLLFAFSSFVIAECGTTHAVGSANAEQEQLARTYRNNGDIEESIETYKKLINANPNHFNSVLYQHEIMRTTEGLSDPRLLTDEIKHTLQMFKTASDENYEGATPEAIQYERDALDEYISDKGKIFHALFQNLTNEMYRSLSMEIYKLFIDNLVIPDITAKFCIIFLIFNTLTKIIKLQLQVIQNCLMSVIVKQSG